MGLSTKVGSFNTGTGIVGSTVVVNDVGFQPKVVFFWWNGRTGTVDASGRATHHRGFGAGTSATDRRYITSLSQDTPTSMLTNTTQGNAACIGITTTGDAIDGLMDIQSMDAGGFTLVVDDVFTASYRVHYLALGGTDITNVTTGQFQGNAAGGTGNQDVTGVGFQPDFVFIYSTGQATANNTIRADSRIMMGATSGSSNQAAWAGGSNDGAANAQAMAYCIAGEFIAQFDAAVTSIADRATMDGFISDGFSLNWLDVAVGSSFYMYVAMKGGRYLVDNLQTQTNTSTPIEKTQFGFTPKAALLLSAGRAVSTADTPTDDDELSMGAFTSTTARVAMSMSDDDAAGTAVVGTGVSHDEVYQNLAAATGAVEGEMDVQSVDTDGFTLIMDDADPAQAFVWFVAFGATPLTQTVSGGITPSGGLLKTPDKSVKGVLTPSGTIIKDAIKTLSGGITPSGSLLKEINKILSGALTLAGDLITSFIPGGETFFQDVGGALTLAGNVLKQTIKSFSGDITPTGSVLKQIEKALSGALSSIVGTLSTNRGYTRGFDGNITPSGVITKQSNKTLSRSLAFLGSLSKSTEKTIAGTLTTAGTLIKQVNKILSGALTSAGTVVGELITGGQTFFKELAGTLTSSGTLSKLTSKLFSGDLTSSGSLTATSVFVKALEGTLTLAGAVVKSTSKQFSGVLTFLGTVSKTTTKSFSGTLSSLGEIAKQTNKFFSGQITSTGSLSSIRLFVKVLEGTLTFAGEISKSISKNLTGEISPLGSLNKLISKALSGVLDFIGTLSTLFGVVQIVDRVYLLGSRILSVPLAGTLSRTKALLGRARRSISLMGKRDIDI